jgi:hypothetical protein
MENTPKSMSTRTIFMYNWIKQIIVPVLQAKASFSLKQKNAADRKNRDRTAGDPKPAGTKISRMAKEGRIGKSHC